MRLLRLPFRTTRVSDEDMLRPVRVPLFEQRARGLDPPRVAGFLEQLGSGGLRRIGAGVDDAGRELEEDGLRARSELAYEHDLALVGQRQDGNQVVLVLHLVLDDLAAGLLEALADDAPVARIHGFLGELAPGLHPVESRALGRKKR